MLADLKEYDDVKSNYLAAIENLTKSEAVIIQVNGKMFCLFEYVFHNRLKSFFSGMSVDCLNLYWG